MTTEPSTQDLALEIESMFDRMIEQAPDIPTQVETTVAKSHSVKESSGWGGKYVSETPLTGERWLAMLERAESAVAACGIVAFLGGRGTGKTQMAAEIARGCAWPNDHGEWNGYCNVITRTALYRRAMDIFLDLRDAGKKGSAISEKDVLAKLERCGLLVIDEFQERGASDWENRIISNLIDKRYSAKRPTIIIANFSREEMGAALSDSIKDRIRENGKRFDFDWDSYRAKP